MSAMHHRKRGATIPWCGMVRFDGRPEFRLGTVYTPDFNPNEARRLLEQAAAALFPSGAVVGHIERGALIYKPHKEEGGE